MVKRAVALIRKHYEDIPIVVNDVRQYVDSFDPSCFSRYENGDQAWGYLEFGDCRGKWSKFRRAFFARTVRLIYTNLGMGGETDQRINDADLGHRLTPEGVIRLAHGRGRDEPVHRALKDFAHQELPFKLFHKNSAYYYTMLIAFILYEAFKEDV